MTQNSIRLIVWFIMIMFVRIKADDVLKIQTINAQSNEDLNLLAINKSFEKLKCELAAAVSDFEAENVDNLTYTKGSNDTYAQFLPLCQEEISVEKLTEMQTDNQTNSSKIGGDSYKWKDSKLFKCKDVPFSGNAKKGSYSLCDLVNGCKLIAEGLENLTILSSKDLLLCSGKGNTRVFVWNLSSNPQKIFDSGILTSKVEKLFWNNEGNGFYVVFQNEKTMFFKFVSKLNQQYLVWFACKSVAAMESACFDIVSEMQKDNQFNNKDFFVNKIKDTQDQSKKAFLDTINTKENALVTWNEIESEFGKEAQDFILGMFDFIANYGYEVHIADGASNLEDVASNLELEADSVAEIASNSDPE